MIERAGGETYNSVQEVELGQSPRLTAESIRAVFAATMNSLAVPLARLPFGRPGYLAKTPSLHCDEAREIISNCTGVRLSEATLKVENRPSNHLR